MIANTQVKTKADIDRLFQKAQVYFSDIKRSLNAIEQKMLNDIFDDFTENWPEGWSVESFNQDDIAENLTEVWLNPANKERIINAVHQAYGASIINGLENRDSGDSMDIYNYFYDSL